MFERAQQIAIAISNLKNEWGSMFNCEWAQQEYQELLAELAEIAGMVA